MLLEAEVHLALRNILREQKDIRWVHHLSMARLVARTVRLQSSVLIQTGTGVDRYSWSYLIPALLTNHPILLVIPNFLGQQFLEQDLPYLQGRLDTHKVIVTENFAPDLPASEQILMVSPHQWLLACLRENKRFPADMVVLIDQAEDLENWTLETLQLSLNNQDWWQLSRYASDFGSTITALQVKLAQELWQNPQNRYDCYELDPQTQKQLGDTLDYLAARGSLSPNFAQFWRQWRQGNYILWASLNRRGGQFQLHLTPADVGRCLTKIWQRYPIVIMGQFLDRYPQAITYRTTVGLPEILSLNFEPDRNTELIQVYSPVRFPFANTPEFQGALIQEISNLVNLAVYSSQGVVILIADTPLKTQVAASLAGKFGSIVQVESKDVPDNGILVTGWEFWLHCQQELWQPQLLIMSTLPLPSLEHPVVASRVAIQKRKNRDWFRHYLLPAAVKNMQRAIVSLRRSQGILAILDNRVNYRSYGNEILNALEPCAKINRLTAIDLVCNQDL